MASASAPTFATGSGSMEADFASPRYSCLATAIFTAFFGAFSCGIALLIAAENRSVNESRGPKAVTVKLASLPSARVTVRTSSSSSRRCLLELLYFFFSFSTCPDAPGVIIFSSFLFCFVHYALAYITPGALNDQHALFLLSINFSVWSAATLLAISWCQTEDFCRRFFASACALSKIVGQMSNRLHSSDWGCSLLSTCQRSISSFPQPATSSNSSFSSYFACSFCYSILSRISSLYSLLLLLVGQPTFSALSSLLLPRSSTNSVNLISFTSSTHLSVHILVLLSILCSTSTTTATSTTSVVSSSLVPASEGIVLQTLLRQLDDTSQCNRVIALPNLQRLLEHTLRETRPQLLLLARIISQHPYMHPPQLPPNATLSTEPPFPLNSSVRAPVYALQYQCDLPGWVPTLVYPSPPSAQPASSSPITYLTLRLQPFDLNACDMSDCSSSKCTWTVHGGLRVHARACCGNGSAWLCRDASDQGRRILVTFNAVCAVVCLVLIPCVFNQRRRHHEARGWALIELFLLGAATLYSILLLDWLSPASSTCCLAVWLRQIGFSTFYGAIVLKIYRNLQEYRVRKAHHVFVKEEDLLKYLACMLALTTTGLTAWTLGSWTDDALWKGSWPQCVTQPWSLTWHGYELLFLLYGMRLCYKARNSGWLERWQFTVAVVLEATVTLIANLIRYSIRYSGHSDTLMTIAFVQLHLTVSVNIVIIIAPKFYLMSSESNRRTQTLSGSGARAHPSLAKLRDNLLNGTIDFAEVPIVDMNPDDIRAELKRVYTQLRMYKLKNIYQDNPHISKRKGGKKSSEKPTKNRRISIPPSNSPKVRRVDEEERSDLTVESAPHNVFLSTYKLQLEPHQSIRV